MRAIHAIGVAMSLSLTGGCSAGSDRSAAEAGVVEFREMVSAGRYSDIYRASADEMRSTISEAQLAEILEMVRERLGEFRSAEQTNWNWNSNNGVAMVELHYDARYAGGAATERYTYRIDAGRAALAGFNINSPALTGNPAPEPAP